MMISFFYRGPRVRISHLPDLKFLDTTIAQHYCFAQWIFSTFFAID